MIETLNALMIARPILVSAKSNADHPLYHHVEELPNFVHIEALQILYAQLEVFTNFYDSAQNFNVRYFLITMILALNNSANINSFQMNFLVGGVSSHDPSPFKMGW